jgi:subtilisin-like proprotein convertase family protein
LKSLPRGEDPFLDLMLDAGRYFVVASHRTPAQQGLRPPVLIAFNLAAECASRQECDTTGPGFCVSDFTCAQPGAGLTEVPAAGTPFTPVDIPDAQDPSPPGMLVSPLVVGGLVGNVAEVQVGVDIRHTWRGDLDITLISPPDPQNGDQPRRVRLLSANDADTGNGVREVFGVTAEPAESLAILQGVPASGTWQLEIVDNANLDLGQLRDFRLFVRTQ